MLFFPANAGTRGAAMAFVATALISAQIAAQTHPSPTTIAAAAPLKEVVAAAESGNADAQMELSRRYAAGEGVQADDTKEFAWCRRAAEQGGAVAEWALARCYQEARGVARDDQQAFKP